MNRLRLLVVLSGMLAAVLVSPGSPAADEAAAKRAAVQAKIEPSVVYLQFWTAGTKDGGEVGRYGTGFVIAAPDARKTKWILTSAHSLSPLPGDTPNGPVKKISGVRYRLPKQETFADCGEVIVDEAHDLAAFRPNPRYPLSVPALELNTDDLGKHESLYAFGSASALPAELCSGYVSADPVTVAEIVKRQRLPRESFRPFADDLTFLRHDILIARGYSGCPVVTAQGKLVGVQSATLQDAAFVGFAIHGKHIRGFDWDRKPLRLTALDLSKFNIDKVLASTAARPVPYKPEVAAPPAPANDPPPVKVKLGGVEVEAPFIHHGYVERNARTVIEKYVQDKEYYTVEKFGGMRVMRLQELLDRTELARISNPVLGFQMLVPKGYRYSAQATTKPDGLLVTFDPPEGRKVAAPYDWPLSIWVTVEPQLYAKARATVIEEVKANKFTDDQKKDAVFLERYMNAVVADTVDPRFATRDLEIRIKDGDKYRGDPKAEAFEQFVAGEGAWFRSNYLSVNGTLCHNVRIGHRDPLVLIVHFQFAKKDAIAFNDLKGTPDPTEMEYALLASTVSTK